MNSVIIIGSILGSSVKSGFLNAEPYCNYLLSPSESGIPDNIKLTVYGDVLHVQWEAPIEPNGITTGFIMQVTPKRPFQAKKSIDHIVVDRIDREYYIRGMLPCTFYMVSIAAMNQAGEGRYFQRRVAVSMPDSMYFYSFRARKKRNPRYQDNEIGKCFIQY